MSSDRTGMVLVEGGTFTMGSEKFYPEEAPLRKVRVSDFWMDTTPVTNRQYADFIEQTGYVTLAEKAPDPKLYPGMLPEMAQAGALVFCKAPGPVDLRNPANWWQFVFGADWRHPYGPGEDIDTLDLWDHPVVQIAYEDALSYAKWDLHSIHVIVRYYCRSVAGLNGEGHRRPPSTCPRTPSSLAG